MDRVARVHLVYSDLQQLACSSSLGETNALPHPVLRKLVFKQEMNPACTLGWICLLSVKIRQSGDDTASYMKQLQDFTGQFDPEQARMWPSRVGYLYRSFTDALVKSGEPVKGVALLRSALQRFPRTPQTITPLHAMLAKLCLLSRMHTVALPFLTTEISSIAPAETATTVEDVLLYLYYGGMVFTGLGQYQDAQDFFASAVSAPAQAVSAIAVEAYKKYVLVSLIAEGSVPSLPRYTSSSVIRTIGGKCRAYDALADAFGKYNVQEVARCVDHDKAVFKADGNLGLVKRCQAELTRLMVVRLTRTYLTLSLADIAQHVGLGSPQEAEHLILRVVETGQVRAKISQADGMVAFLEPAELYDTVAASKVINGSISGTLALKEKVAEANVAVLTSRAYQSKLRAGRARDKMPPGLGATSAGPGSESDRDTIQD